MKSACASRTCPVFLFFVSFAVVAAAGPSASPPTLQDVINRLDKSADQFHGMSAQVSKTEHTQVLNENSTETGTVYMKKSGKSLQAMMDISAPDEKAYAFEGRHVQIYYPNMKQVQIYDVGAGGEQLAAQFFTLGFGTSGKDLEKSYAIRVVGNETVDGQNTTHIVLTPKSGQATQLVKDVDLWIGDGNYPVQEKVVEPSGDYLLFVYSNVKMNPPLNEQDLKLKLPAGVSKVYPQKQ